MMRTRTLGSATKLTRTLGMLLGTGMIVLAQATASDFTPILNQFPEAPARPLSADTDWLLDDSFAKAGIYRSADGQSLVLDNALVRRVIRIHPNAATTEYIDLRTGESRLRAVSPEAVVTLDGKEWNVGGLVGQPNRAFLKPEWIESLQDDPSSFFLESLEAAEVAKPFEWKKTRPSEDRPWPPRGRAIVLHFAGRTEPTKGVRVSIRYEVYDGIPVIGKSLTISNGTSRSIVVDSLTPEILALVEGESAVDSRDPGQWRRPPIDVFSDYMFHGMDTDTANRVAYWEKDPAYTTQVSYALQTPCVLRCRPPIGPAVTVKPNERLSAFRVWTITHDSTERERQGLSLRRAWRVLAPWVTENPIMMHVRYSDRANFRKAVDQCAEVGFEMIIYTFGSGLNMEDNRPAELARIKEDVDYAHAKGVQVGGYSLFSSRRIDDENDVIDPETLKPGGAIFGQAPCLGSRWGKEYLQQIKSFMEQTGFDLLEHDGPYPGDLCASTSHPGHEGLEDSQWKQWEASRDLYRWCRARGIYVNQPDCYFLCGGSKTGMGYRETNWSLPRAEQLIHARQNIYDGTWNKTVTMGWMFVPLTEYHGGGAAATLEPLREHLDDYERHLMNGLGGGVQACYRGPRLYDSDVTRNLLVRWIDWYKKYRDILESDVIHGRRADGRDVDFLVHVNPNLPRRALAVIYNPLTQPASRSMQIPLYYTGLKGSAKIRVEDGKAKEHALDDRQRARVDVTIPAQGMTWLVIEE